MANRLDRHTKSAQAGVYGVFCYSFPCHHGSLPFLFCSLVLFGTWDTHCFSACDRACPRSSGKDTMEWRSAPKPHLDGSLNELDGLLVSALVYKI